MLDNFPAKKVFCIGIGGIGVSGLAELLHQKGIAVSGSDPTKNAQTERLKSLGITVIDHHAGKNIDEAELVVYTSVVKSDNPERRAAIAANIPLMTRGQLLAAISEYFCNIIVAGTHGKTTTSGIITWLFEQAKMDPTSIIGGVLRNRHSPMQLGKSNYFIAESDESDASFLFFSPTTAVITNIGADHMETYGYDFEKLKNSFLQFASKVPQHGFVVACIDDPTVRDLIPKIKGRIITYGEHDDADCQLKNFCQIGLYSEFTAVLPDKKELKIRLNLIGKHNALNALSAIIIAHEYNFSDSTIQNALESFPGMNRRFHPHGEISVSNGKALLFDDYGHHPTEVQATLIAAKLAFPDRRLVMVFQPHRYSRTRDLLPEFVDVLKTVDQLILTQVYAANEQEIAGVSGQVLFHALQNTGAKHIIFVPDISQLPAVIQQTAQSNDLVLLQGAGNIVTIAEHL